MKLKLFYYLFILLSVFSCRQNYTTISPKVKKIPVHIFTGKGEHNETVNWFYIKKVVENGFGGYYLESDSKVNDFKHANFIYSGMRPLKFEAQAPSGENVQFLSPDDLPENIVKDSAALETFYE